MPESSPARSANHPAIPERGVSAPRGYIANAMSGTHAALDPDPGMSGVLGAVRASATPIEDPDAEFIEAWRRGSNAALDALFQRVQPRIHGLCIRMLGRPEVAADVAQDAFLRIYEGLPGFDGRARFSTWSIRVTLNCIYTHLRREKLRRHARLPEPETGFEPRSREPEPEARIERTDLRRNVVVALGTLDLQARAILVLRDLQGLDYADIAEVLGTPIGTVKSRLFRARAALREALEALGHGRG
jgi:RNA polymerase sigma-70 factor (ECF subfamily)